MTTKDKPKRKTLSDYLVAIGLWMMGDKKFAREYQELRRKNREVLEKCEESLAAFDKEYPEFAPPEEGKKDSTK